MVKRSAASKSARPASGHNEPDRPTVDIPVGQLDLDSQNPRLETGLTRESSTSLVKVMWEEMAVAEVALSIAANGFFRQEPLFVVPSVFGRDKKQRYAVVEGNRRLAAVMLLRDKALREQVGATSLPQLTPTEIGRLDALPAVVYENRQQLWPFLGFRHINGPMAWDAYSKARYVAMVVDQYHVPVVQIAKNIGDEYGTVKRFFGGYRLLQQAQTDGDFQIDDVYQGKFNFSHLYTAANYPEFQRFLGLPDRERLLQVKPVPKDHVSELKEFMLWLFGSRSRDRPRVCQDAGPDVPRALGPTHHLSGR